MANHQSPPYPDLRECRDQANQLLLGETDHEVARHLLAWCEVAEGRVPHDLFNDLLRDTDTSRNVPHHANLGWMLTQCRQSRPALNRLSNDLDEEPENEDLWVSSGICLQRVRDFRTSARVLGKVLEKSPHNLLARRYYANALMNSGKWKEGFVELEKSRGELTSLQSSFFLDKSRHWQGQDIEGKHILIVGNGRQSDQIQFCRFVHELRKRKPHKIGFACDPELVELMRSLPDISRVDTRRFEPHDYYVPVESLPLRLGAEPSNLEDPGPYLRYNHRQADLKRRKIKGSKPLLGICWRSTQPEGRDESTISYEKRANSLDLLPLEWHLSELAMDYDLVSFQEDLRLDERQLLNLCGVKIIEQEEFRDFSVVAEWLSCLDVLVTVDSPVAHLSGAIGGVETHVLLPFVPEWKWCAEKGRSPWYPRFKTHQKLTEDSWEECLEEVMSELKAPISLKMAS